MFEAVNAIDRRYQTYLNVPQADRTASQDAAAATAAYKVLLKHYPANKAALDESYTLSMAGIGGGAAVEAGKAVGEQAAAAAMDANGIDPAITQVPYRPLAAAGEWVATALPTLDPYWPALKPWVIKNPDALRPPPPPALTSEIYARDYEEVRRLGGKDSKERTPYQALIARYRQAFDISPAVRRATDAPGRSQVENARFLALYQMANDDATQAMVVAKQHYEFWRPITAIRNGDKDGNPATQPDPAWEPLIATPNFQEYPCGHCTLAGSIAEVMEHESGWKPGQGVRVGSLLNPTRWCRCCPTGANGPGRSRIRGCSAGCITVSPTKPARRLGAKPRGRSSRPSSNRSRSSAEGRANERIQCRRRVARPPVGVARHVRAAGGRDWAHSCGPISSSIRSRCRA